MFKKFCCVNFTAHQGHQELVKRPSEWKISRNLGDIFHSLDLGPFQEKIKTSGFSLEFPALENIPQFPQNPAEVDQNYDARKGVSATLTVFK